MKTFTKKSVAIVLAILMVFSTIIVGTITSNAADATKVYFVNSDNWSSVACYTYEGEGETLDTWPGTLATKEETVDGYDIYSATPGAASKFIFNDYKKDGAQQTDNLNVADGLGKYYEKLTKSYYDTAAEAVAALKAALPSGVGSGYYVPGEFNNWALDANTQLMKTAESDEVASVSVEIAEAKTYEFGVATTGWSTKYTGATITKDNCTDVPLTLNASDNNKIEADVTGTYVFKFNTSTNTLTVTYPENVTDPASSTTDPASSTTETASSTTDPDETGTTNPDETGTTDPDDTGVTNPDETGTTNPDDTGVTNPDETGTTGSSDPEESVVYFVNTNGLTNPINAYAYKNGGAGENADWPGVLATVVDEEKGIYSYDTTGYDFVIFTDKTVGTYQTPNIEVASNNGKYFEPKTAKLYDTYEAAIEASVNAPTFDYYVRGSEGLCSGVNWDISPLNGMTKGEDGVYTKVYENVAAGTYSFKIGSDSVPYIPDGEGNDSTVTVAENGATVYVVFDPAKGYGIAAVGEKPTYPEIIETSSETQPTTSAPTVPDGQLKVTVKSNVCDIVDATYKTNLDNTITVTFSLQAVAKILNSQGTLTYDGAVLKLVSFEMPNIGNSVINTDLLNRVEYNYTDASDLYDFSTSKVYCEAKFTVLSGGDTTVELNVIELNANTGSGDIAYVTDSVINAEIANQFTISVALNTPSTDPTTPATTAPPKKTPSLEKSSVNKKAGSTYKIVVKNANGQKIKYKTNKKNILKVSSKGKVTYLKKGTGTITVTVGSKKLTFKGKVTSDPKLTYKNKTVKASKTYKVSKGKTITIKIKGKASALKNKYKSTKIAKIKGKTTASKFKIKGLKKGTTTLKITVNRSKTLKIKVKVK